jgi:hypothetical protein
VLALLFFIGIPLLGAVAAIAFGASRPWLILAGALFGQLVAALLAPLARIQISGGSVGGPHQVMMNQPHAGTTAARAAGPLVLLVTALVVGALVVAGRWFVLTRTHK